MDEIPSVWDEQWIFLFRQEPCWLWRPTLCAVRCRYIIRCCSIPLSVWSRPPCRDGRLCKSVQGRTSDKRVWTTQMIQFAPCCVFPKVIYRTRRNTQEPKSAVGTVASYRLDDRGSNHCGGQETFLFENRPAWSTHSLPFRRHRGCFPGVKRPGSQADNSALPNAKYKNEWSCSCTSTPLHAFKESRATTFCHLSFTHRQNCYCCSSNVWPSH